MGGGVRGCLCAYRAHQDSHRYYLYTIYYMSMYLHSKKFSPISKQPCTYAN